jgi:electron transfer flavoprotein beta subunit
MPLEIIVCIKQVPHPEHFSRIRLDSRTRTLIRGGIPAIINPLDLHALEEGLRLRERFSGKVTALSMGPPKAREALEEALAIGADEAVLLCDPAFAGADTLATVRVISTAIRKLGYFDLILCGNETIDGGTAQVGPQLAEFLGLPHVTHVDEIEVMTETSGRARRALELGYMRVEFQLPALLAVTRRINQPRLPTVLGIMEATRKPIQTWDMAALGLRQEEVGVAGSPTRVVDMLEYRSERRREILQGSTSEVVKKALRRLQELGAL